MVLVFVREGRKKKRKQDCDRIAFTNTPHGNVNATSPHVLNCPSYLLVVADLSPSI